jgi:nucleoside-diphosphate-sugar epimerase
VDITTGDVLRKEVHMKVLVIGGTGYIGAAVVRQLGVAGHLPVVLVRDPSRAPEAVESRVGDLTDPAALRAAITPDIDVVVHAATPSGDWASDLEAIDTLVAALTGRALVYLSGVWVLGRTVEPADESAPTRPIDIVARRPEAEERVLTAGGVRGVVIRPGIVHGAGGGIPGMMVDWARRAGVGRHVGEAGVRWPMVHLDDLADLVVLAVERAEAGSVLHGVAEPAVPVKELAAAADVAAGGAGGAEEWPEDEAATDLGAPFAQALALDQEVVAVAATHLGWAPSRADAVTDLRSGSY